MGCAIAKNVGNHRNILAIRLKHLLLKLVVVTVIVVESIGSKGKEFAPSIPITAESNNAKSHKRKENSSKIPFCYYSNAPSMKV